MTVELNTSTLNSAGVSRSAAPLAAAAVLMLSISVGRDGECVRGVSCEVVWVCVECVLMWVECDMRVYCTTVNCVSGGVCVCVCVMPGVVIVCLYLRAYTRVCVRASLILC